MSILKLIDAVENQITIIHERLKCLLSDRKDKVDLLIQVPGINELSAHSILSEIGDTLEQFESPAAIASWCGLCPGNNESAGKRHSGRSHVKSNHMKTLMTEVAWGAIRKKGSYYIAFCKTRN